jgi:hypothetical protein
MSALPLAPSGVPSATVSRLADDRERGAPFAGRFCDLFVMGLFWAGV